MLSRAQATARLSPIIERLSIRDSLVVTKDMGEESTSVRNDMSLVLKIPHSVKAGCGFRTDSRECIQDGNQIHLTHTHTHTQCNAIQRIIKIDKLFKM